jgi:DNA polymerase-3 subunit epsilon
MRGMLAMLAHDHALCLTRLGLERRVGPCFSRELRRCRGVCDGTETAQAHDERLREALAPLALPPWPFAGAAVIREASDDGERVDVHVVRDWTWIGTARDEGELASLLEAPPRPTFDVDVTKLLLRTWAKRRSAFVRVPDAAFTRRYDPSPA